MTYNCDSHITTVKDVETFFDYIVFERNVNFHPDEDFNNYVSLDNGKPTFTKDEIIIFNRLMDEAFDVCETNNVDIYKIGIEKLWKALGIPQND